MAVRTYEVRGYRNTGYSPGAIDSAEFDRPFSQEVFENLYPDDDGDIIELQEIGAKFLLRSLYYKKSLKIKHRGTQKDIIYQIDYLRIKAVNGGENRECAYYFVNSALTEWVSADTAVLYLTLDEQTTANATQTTKISGIIEKRNIHGDEDDLNFYPEEFSPMDPMRQDIAYITAEDALGYTIADGSGMPSKVTGVLQLAAVYCDLGQMLATTPVVAELPATANSLTVSIEGKNDFDVIIDNMVLVDTDNADVKKALNILRELGNEGMIGSVFSFPNQCLKREPDKVLSNGVELITGIAGGSFVFTIDNLSVIPTYSGIYSNLVNKKAGYQFTTYSVIAPSSGETKTYTLQEILDSITGSKNSASALPTEQVKFMGTGIPMSEGALYWKPVNLTMIKSVPGYDKRIAFIDTVRGSNWNQDGLVLTGQANAPLLAQQLQAANDRKKIDDDIIDKTLSLTKENISQAKFQSTLGLAGSGANFLGSIASKDPIKIIGAALKLAPGLAQKYGATQGDGGGFLGMDTVGLLGDTYERQTGLAVEQANLAKDANALGLKSVQFAADYSKQTQSLAVQPPTGLDMNRIMGSSMMVIRTTPSVADVKKFDLLLTWTGTTVHESYDGLLKDHEYMLDAGEDFSFMKLGMCTISLPNEPSGWANSLAWRRKIQAEMQTGGRYWKKKILDYEWKMPIPTDYGYSPTESDGEIVYYESIIANGDKTTESLEITLSDDIEGLAIGDITVRGATKIELESLGNGRYLVYIENFDDGDLVEVLISKKDYRVLPNSRTVTVIREWQPSKLGIDIDWVSAEASPYSLGFDMYATNEVSNELHYILWKLGTDFIVTRVDRMQHSFYASVTIPDLLVGTNYEEGLLVMGGVVYIVHSASVSDKVNLVDVTTGETIQIDKTGNSGTLTGRSGYGNFLLGGTNGNTFVRYYPALARGVSVNSRLPVPVRSSYPMYWFRSYTYSMGPTTTGEDVYTMVQLSEETQEQLYQLTSGLYSNTHNYGFQRMTEEGYFVGVRGGNAGLLKLDFATGVVSLIDDTVYTNGTTATHGPVFKQGLYIRRGGSWYFRYNNGDELSVEDAPLAPMLNASYRFQFYTDGNNFYRLLG